MIDFRAAYGDSEDDERSDPELQALSSPEHSQPPHYPPRPPAIPRPRHADPDMRKATQAINACCRRAQLRDSAARCGYPDGARFREHPQRAMWRRSQTSQPEAKARYITH